MTYLEPTEASGAALYQRGLTGPVLMLNLLRFRAVADYEGDPDLTPDQPISGAEAFDLYVDLTLPLLRAKCGDLTMMATGGPYLIGPSEEVWDRVMLVRQPSVAAFMDWAQDETYLAGIGHRSAALQDARLLPLSELPHG